MWRSHVRKTGCFTLIEVLVALMIIAIALTAAIKSTNSSINTTNRLRETLAAHWVALNVLSQMQTGLWPLPNEGASDGQSSMLGRDFHWSAAQTTSSASPTIVRITVRVSLDKRALDTVTGYADNAKS